jgi:asparagine synthetase A
LSGAQRIHDAPMLEAEMIKKGIEPASMKHYVDAFRLGCPPHGGGGIGESRISLFVMVTEHLYRARAGCYAVLEVEQHSPSLHVPKGSQATCAVVGHEVLR